MLRKLQFAFYDGQKSFKVEYSKEYPLDAIQSAGLQS